MSSRKTKILIRRIRERDRLSNRLLSNRRLSNRRLSNRRLSNRRLSNRRLSNRRLSNRQMTHFMFRSEKMVGGLKSLFQLQVGQVKCRGRTSHLRRASEPFQNRTKTYIIPGRGVEGGGRCLALTPPPEKILSLDPPSLKNFLAKNGKIWPKNCIFCKFCDQPLRFSQICCKIS